VRSHTERLSQSLPQWQQVQSVCAKAWARKLECSELLLELASLPVPNSPFWRLAQVLLGLLPV